MRASCSSLTTDDRTTAPAAAGPDEGNMNRAQGFMVDYFKNFQRVFDPIKDKLTKYEWGQDVGPGIIALDTRGHSSLTY